MRAAWYYYRRANDEAARLFEELRNIDPYRLEHMDLYSNVLFVLVRTLHNNKYLPSSCNLSFNLPISLLFFIGCQEPLEFYGT
jgi:hypothetical protein